MLLFFTLMVDHIRKSWPFFYLPPSQISSFFCGVIHCVMFVTTSRWIVTRRKDSSTSLASLAHGWNRALSIIRNYERHPIRIYLPTQHKWTKSCQGNFFFVGITISTNMRDCRRRCGKKKKKSCSFLYQRVKSWQVILHNYLRETAAQSQVND